MTKEMFELNDEILYNAAGGRFKSKEDSSQTDFIMLDYSFYLDDLWDQRQISYAARTNTINRAIDLRESWMLDNEEHSAEEFKTTVYKLEISE